MKKYMDTIKMVDSMREKNFYKLRQLPGNEKERGQPLTCDKDGTEERCPNQA